MSKQVKRVLVPHRENPIVNRLNKTKVEKKPDLKAERDDMLKELRKRDQAAQLIKVRASFSVCYYLHCASDQATAFYHVIIG